MPKKTVDAVDVRGKRVLIRVDFNVPIKDGQVTDDLRIRSAVPTIKSVIDRGGRAVLMSHLGRPEGKGHEAEHSLRPAAEKLAEILGRPVAFPSNDCTDQASADAVASMKDGDVLLLENLRFHKAETKGDAAFSEKLARLGDVYVNDAFGTAHREHASMVGVPRAMPAGSPKVSGFLMEKEIRYLSETLGKPEHPFVVVLGGAKVSDKLPAIENLLPKADDILIGGAMAYTFLKAIGKRVGSSRVEEDKVSVARQIIDKAANTSVELHLPTDHVCASDFSERPSKIDTCVEHIGEGLMGLDIGPDTQNRYARVLSKAKTVVWNGPMGVFEWSLFSVGTKAVARAIVDATEKNGATSIVGGGDSAAAAEEFGIADRLTHVSTGGGASLEMLEGKKFASVELLDEA